MYRGTQREKVIIYIQATISSSVKTSLQCAFKPHEEEEEEAASKRLVFLLFQRVFQKHWQAHD